MKQHELAIIHADLAISLNKENALPYRYKGNALECLNKLDEAKQNYKVALTINPYYYDV